MVYRKKLFKYFCFTIFNFVIFYAIWTKMWIVFMFETISNSNTYENQRRLSAGHPKEEEVCLRAVELKCETEIVKCMSDREHDLRTQRACCGLLRNLAYSDQSFKLAVHKVDIMKNIVNAIRLHSHDAILCIQALAAAKNLCDVVGRVSRFVKCGGVNALDRFVFVLIFFIFFKFWYSFHSHISGRNFQNQKTGPCPTTPTTRKWLNKGFWFYVVLMTILVWGLVIRWRRLCFK